MGVDGLGRVGHVWITGANSGVGLAASLALARQGWFITMACRSEKRGQQAVEKVWEAAGQESARLVLCDLASLSSVRQASSTAVSGEESLDVLINNAGTIQARRQVTEDGFELQLAANHLGHFLLTHRLLPRLEKAEETPRIINVTSGAHRIGRMHWDDLQLERGYSPFRAYAQSKLANILFTYELARRLDGRGVANCMHPGAVASNFGVESGGRVAKFVFTAFRPFFLTPAAAAEPLVRLAAGSEGAETGRYFHRAREAASSKASYDEDAARRLWEISAELVGLTEEERRGL